MLGKELVCSCMPAWQFSLFPLFLTDGGVGKAGFLLLVYRNSVSIIYRPELLVHF